MSSATSASLWAVAGGAGTRGISFLVFLFIARQLSPADMGVMAIAMAFSLFMDALNELGMPDQIVRFKGCGCAESLVPAHAFPVTPTWMGAGRWCFSLV